MIPQSKFIKSLNKELSSLGGRLYFVGGVVRDEFVGIHTKDIDMVVTGITKEVFEKVLSNYCNVQLVGKSFGVYKCKQDGFNIDIAFPRKEVSTGEHHCDFEVEHGPHISLVDDLFRRDFTINAMARDVETGELIDPYGGKEDLSNKLLRQLSDNSIMEDYLRALRAIQFVARFGFDIDTDTLANIARYKYLIETISLERISIEFRKFFKGTYLNKAVQYLSFCELLVEEFSGITSEQWSKIENFNKNEVFDEVVVFAMYFSFLDGGKKVRDILQIDKVIFKKINDIVDVISKKETDIVEVKMILNFLGLDDYKRLLVVRKYLGLITKPEYVKLFSILGEVLEGEHPYLLEHLAVNGNDLTESGLKGKQIGDTLKAMLHEVIIDHDKNKREYLLGIYLRTK